MCLNNWGGINHKVLEFNEYVNLFSGKSGSGKSTVMDAIQVILYGSFSPSFLNKAADDAKNRRSVLSYLRGEQKDGSANRGNCDFCSVIALEIKDTGTHITTCVGIAFEVRRNDSEIKKFSYFSHSGKMPEPGYITEEGFCYSNQDIKKLVNERAVSKDNRGKGDVNRIYASKEAYLGTLYDVILGYIDPNRFITMEKSAIALKMTNGTGQFIRDYMFPKSTSDTIGTISEQLDAYRQIKEKIEDMRKRIELLTDVKETGQELVTLQTDMIRTESFIRCIDIEDLRAKIEAAEEDKKRIEEEQAQLQQQADRLAGERGEVEQELIRVSADLKASDLGSKQQQLEELEQRSRMLTDNSRQWRKIVQGLKQWEEDEVITDYISNPVLNLIETIENGNVTVIHCTYDPETKSGSGFTGRKVKGTIHWVSAPTAGKVECRLYENIVDEEKGKLNADGTLNLNPNSKTITTAYVEPKLMEAKAYDSFQFMRNGYYCVDCKDSKEGQPVYNRIVSLKSSFKLPK